MKRYIRTQTELADSILLKDCIVVDVDFLYDISASRRIWKDNTRFPSKDQFRLDVLHILEDEYHFEVKEDNYSGNLQKGWASNREDSESVYFNTLYDIQNSAQVESAPALVPGIEGNVFCYILFRFSDHLPANGMNTKEEQNFYQTNKLKHIANRNDVVYDEEAYIQLDEETLQLHYNEALEELRDSVELYIAKWVKILNRRYS